MVLLFRMLGGSHLYGTNHQGSDYDWYEIVDQGKPFHRAHDPVHGDITRWPLSMLMKIADKGGHNALQMMFADPEWCEVDLIKDLRLSYRTNIWVCEKRFTAVRDSYQERGDVKGLRYAEMFDRWMQQIKDTGRFDPHNRDWQQRTSVYNGTYGPT